MNRAYAYRNLHKKCWSVRPSAGGRVEHGQYVELADVVFKVSERARQRVIAEKCRRVHAYVAGELVTHGEQGTRPAGRWVRFTYRPFEAGTFLAGARPVYAASRVVLDSEGAWALAPIYRPPAAGQRRSVCRV
jgi:hypothetical protein